MSNFFYSRIRYEMTERGMRVAFLRTTPYGSNWAECKGDPLAKQQEASQIAFNNQLQAIFTQQFAQQQTMLGYLKGKLQPMIDHPVGYSDEALAAMRTSATDALSANYDNAQKALNNQQNKLNGGSDLPSGAGAQLDAALLQSEATDKANAQNTLTLNNENLKQSNYWNALNILNGQSANQYSPLGYAGAYNQGSSNVAGLSQAVTASKQSPLASLAGAAMGGAGTAIGGIYCWVAASLFNGWDSPQTKLVRLWLTCRAPAWFRKFYVQNGEWISKTKLRFAFYPLFKYVLVRYAPTAHAEGI